MVQIAELDREQRFRTQTDFPPHFTQAELDRAACPMVVVLPGADAGPLRAAGLACIGAEHADSHEAEWSVLCAPGEDDPVSVQALLALVAELASLPPDANAVEIPRLEDSPSGRRWMPVVRAWRRGSFRGFDRSADPTPLVAGRILRSLDLRIQVDPARRNDLVGRAYRAEANGDWLDGHRFWSLAASGAGGAAGYARLRAALRLGFLDPRAEAVRDQLGQAWAETPRLPEAGLRLAGWWLGRGRPDEALAVAGMADSIALPLAPVPQMEGAGDWLVSARMALWFAPVDRSIAARLARKALGRNPPPDLVRDLNPLAQTTSTGSEEHHHG